MKRLKALGAALVIALSLSIPAYAEDPPPGDVHVPGSPNPITAGGAETPVTTSDNPGLAGGATAVDGDVSFSALTDVLWALASIF